MPYRAVAANPLTFSIKQPAPSEAAIQSRREAVANAIHLSMAQEIYFRTCLVVSALWCPCLVFSCMAFILGTLSSLDLELWRSGPPAAIYPSLGLLVMGCLSCLFNILLDADNRRNAFFQLKRENAQLEDVLSSDCADLLAALRVDEQAQAYHEQVIEQGRRFVAAELDMAKNWAESYASREACRTLYRIPKNG